MFEVYTGDPLATKYMAWPRVTTPEDGRPFVELIDSSFSGVPVGAAQFAWLIQLKTTGEFLGSCGIGADQDMSAGGGYILHPRFWGQGYAAEAFTAVVDWAREQPDVHRIEATTTPITPLREL
jgi:RimJ/RimL family protein N-acetyltransferase